MIVRVVSIAVFLVLLCGAPTVQAAFTAYRVDRSDLDDAAVDQFPIPILFGVEREEIVSDFADPRSSGRSHEGQDIRALEGTPVVSPTEAIVLSVGFGESAGNFVYTANPGGETFRYMHLETVADLRRGDRLAVGDLIGTVGDTGNAPPGIYHLHLEVRNDDNKATDPYDRLDESFSVKEKMSFLRDILRAVDDADTYAAFLVEAFPADFAIALDKKYRLPSEITAALEESGAADTAELLTQLDQLIRSIPDVVQVELGEGATGVAVSLLQTFLIYTTEGSARDRLAAAGATGYYGSLTAAAVTEYQVAHDLAPTGTYDAKTRAAMRK